MSQHYLPDASALVVWIVPSKGTSVLILINASACYEHLVSENISYIGEVTFMNAQFREGGKSCGWSGRVYGGGSDTVKPASVIREQAQPVLRTFILTVGGGRPPHQTKALDLWSGFLHCAFGWCTGSATLPRS